MTAGDSSPAAGVAIGVVAAIGVAAAGVGGAIFLYIKGVDYAGLGPSGMIFFITPTGQFLLGFFYYNEPFSTQKFVSFVLIWIAVIIYLKDLYENY